MTIAPTEPVAWRFSLHDAPGWQYSSVDPALHRHATEAVIEPLFSLAAAPVPSPHGKEVREAVARAIRKHVHGSTTIGADGFSRPGLGVVGVDAATDAILALIPVVAPSEGVEP